MLSAVELHSGGGSGYNYPSFSRQPVSSDVQFQAPTSMSGTEFARPKPKSIGSLNGLVSPSASSPTQKYSHHHHEQNGPVNLAVNHHQQQASRAAAQMTHDKDHLDKDIDVVGLGNSNTSPSYVTSSSSRLASSYPAAPSGLGSNAYQALNYSFYGNRYRYVCHPTFLKLNLIFFTHSLTLVLQYSHIVLPTHSTTRVVQHTCRHSWKLHIHHIYQQQLLLQPTTQTHPTRRPDLRCRNRAASIHYHKVSHTNQQTKDLIRCRHWAMAISSNNNNNTIIIIHIQWKKKSRNQRVDDWWALPMIWETEVLWAMPAATTNTIITILKCLPAKKVLSSIASWPRRVHTKISTMESTEQLIIQLLIGNY